jgi:hypothetical protein
VNAIEQDRRAREVAAAAEYDEHRRGLAEDMARTLCAPSKRKPERTTEATED